tara:strand:+ start:806 stop:1396 length:591 start_codon:yes stop_codon:yes gene_type:complete
MKLRQHLELEPIITGKKLPCDVEHLEHEYHSKSRDITINIGDMELIYFVRVFNQTKSDYDDMKISVDSSKRAYEMQKERMIRLQEEIDELKNKNETLNGIIEEKDEILHKLLDRPHWTEPPTNGHRYVFSGIPNDTEGQETLDNIKKYLNKESYTIRVKGQHLKKELYGQGKAYHGATLGDSTHMRVYIDKKKGEE